MVLITAAHKLRISAGLLSVRLPNHAWVINQFEHNSLLGCILRYFTLLIYRVDKKWADVRISGSSTDRMTALTVPGAGQILQLKIGGTVSSTSSVHPTRETWLNIQPSNSRAAPFNRTEKTTMGDIQEMFNRQQESQSDKETQVNNKHESKRAKQIQSEA